MCILFPSNLNVLYCLSPNAYSYIVSADFLHAKYEGHCLNTYEPFFIKRLANLSLVKVNLMRLKWFCINYFHKMHWVWIFLFFHWQEHQTVFFENAVIYSCMRSTSVNMFSANCKNRIFGREHPSPTQKVE